MKTCTKCKAEKQFTEFSKCSRSKDGFAGKCKLCVREYYKSNIDKISERHKEYYRANSENIKTRVREYSKENAEKITEQRKEYRKSNAKKIAERDREYRKANQEIIPDRRREYRKANPEKESAKNRNRKARVRNAEGKHTASDVRAIFENQLGLCANCQTKLFKSGIQKYHVDHIMPLALGGSNWPGNLQCLCPACNLSKGAKHPDDWAATNGRLL